MARQPSRTAAPTPTDDAAPQTEAPADRSGRTPDGKFARGNRGGPGNPFARRVAELRCAFVGAVLPKDLQQIARRLITMAVMGDLGAAKLVTGYVLGKVPSPVDPDTLDQQECRIYQQNISCTDIGEIVQHRPPADMAAGILQANEIANGERAHQFAQQIREELRQEEEQQHEATLNESRNHAEDGDLPANPVRAEMADLADASADTSREKRRRAGAGRPSTVRSVHGKPDQPVTATAQPLANHAVGSALAAATEPSRLGNGPNGSRSPAAVVAAPPAVGTGRTPNGSIGVPVQ